MRRHPVIAEAFTSTVEDRTRRSGLRAARWTHWSSCAQVFSSRAWCDGSILNRSGSLVQTCQVNSQGVGPRSASRRQAWLSAPRKSWLPRRSSWLAQWWRCAVDAMRRASCLGQEGKRLLLRKKKQTDFAHGTPGARAAPEPNEQEFFGSSFQERTRLLPAALQDIEPGRPTPASGHPRNIGRSTHNGAAITRTPAPPAPAAENRPVPSSTPGTPPARHPYPAVSAPHDAVCIPSARRGTACSAGPGMHWPDAQTGAGRTPARRRAGGKGEARPHHRHKGEGGAWTAPTRADPNTAKRARQAAGAGFAQVNGAGPGVRPATPAARRIVR